MVNSAEHGILNANKYKNIKQFSIVSGSDKPTFIMLFFQFRMFNANSRRHLNISEQETFRVQMS